MTLHELLERAAERAPDAPAVVDGERTVPYAELDRKANRIANALISAGVRRGDRVGVWAPKSAETVAALYGVMKAGAAYVPADAASPASRAAAILGDCGVRAVVASPRLAKAVSEVPGSPATLLLPEEEGEPDPRFSRRPGVRAIGSDLAYVLYTSGSTGRPKGVTLTHANALAFVRWAVRELGVGPRERLASQAPFHFDLSVLDLYGAAAAAACLVLVPEEVVLFPRALVDVVREREVTVWYSVPSALASLVAGRRLERGALPRLRTIVFAGEVFPIKHLRALMLGLPHVAFYNFFGPTETNVCTFHRLHAAPAAAEAIPIGRPIDDVDVFAVDDGRVVGGGEGGELYVRGATVMRGYWGDAEATGAALVDRVAGLELPGPYYRTGDLVRVGEDGVLWFVGRRDDQVKSRGYRIELGEVEAAIHAHPLVDACAVVALPDEAISARLKAYVVPRGSLGEHDLRTFLAGRLPPYMIPAELELARELPLTSTGKVDRRALADGRR